jgi:hypothetical protein
MAQAPARVEMRLRQEFRTQHVTLKVRRAAVVTAWALAAAAVLIGAVSWRNWRTEETANHLTSPQSAAKPPANNSNVMTSHEKPVQSAAAVRQSDAAEAETLMADNEMSGFTFLPGAFAADTGDAEILRVRMQRGALGALGLPVNEERVGDWIQVDLLVGNDGLPEAVRLPR